MTAPIRDEDFDIFFGRSHHQYDPSLQDGQEGADNEDPFIQDPTTGRKLFRKDCKPALALFLQAYHNKESFQPNISTSEITPKRYVCRIELPSTLALGDISSSLCSTIVQAECEACFKACQNLYEQSLLDYQYFPSRGERTPDSLTQPVESSGAIATTGMRRYKKATPLFWTIAPPKKTNRLYPLLVTIRGLLAEPILLLTRLPLPELPHFSVFASASREQYTVNCLRCKPTDVYDEQLDLLHRYSSRLVRAITNRDITLTQEDFLFLFSPLQNLRGVETWSKDKWYRPDIDGFIAWDAIKLAADRIFVPLVQEGSPVDWDSLHDVIIQDRWVEFTNRHELIQVRHDLTPNSKNPDSQVSRVSCLSNINKHISAFRTDIVLSIFVELIAKIFKA